MIAAAARGRYDMNSSSRAGAGTCVAWCPTYGGVWMNRHCACACQYATVWMGMASANRTGPARGKAGAETRAGRSDWIGAGLSLLGRAGIEAVRVEPLAVTL